MDNIVSYIQQNELGFVTVNEDMKYHSTMRCGGKVSVLYIPDKMTNLLSVLKLLKKYNINYKVIGRGSNLIFKDGHLDIFVIKISKVLDFLEIESEIVRVGAGYSTQKLAKSLSKKGYKGLEFAGGIPGSLGGLVYMNAGAHTGEISKLVKEVEVLNENSEIEILTNEQCEFGYRNSVFHNRDCIIVSVTLQLEMGDKAAVFKTMMGNLEYRKEMQPLQLPSCGSSFKNPVGFHAGKLIEDCGLKGHTIGGAQVSTKHANFIVNVNNATSKDVIDLISHVQKVVKEKYDLDLQSELEIVGE